MGRKRRRPTELKVSDHARVRYLQRVVGMDMRELDDMILTDLVRQHHEALGDGRFPIGEGDGAIAIINNNTVVSVWRQRRARE